MDTQCYVHTYGCMYVLGRHKLSHVVDDALSKQKVKGKKEC
jgi:dolichyl-phosphate-mannose--protein O-mannosyl transferase